MAKATTAIVAFNRGLVSPLALGRVDLKRMAFSADTQINWVPRVMGSMGFRPGLGYLGEMPGLPRLIPFVFSADDTALLEITNGVMRVVINDSLVVRGSVSTAITNGTFDSNLTGWTDADEVGAASAWASGGYMELLGDGSAAAVRLQAVSVTGSDIGQEHALSIYIARQGPVTLRVGSTLGGDEYIRDTPLASGHHSLAFTPTGTFYVQFMSRLDRRVYVDSCTIEAAGAMRITAPWQASDLRRIRYEQSADVMFVACAGYQQKRIERRAARSWSIVNYLPSDGPFRTENVGPITITPSALTGNITLTATTSSRLFRPGHVGSLWRLTSAGQRVEQDISAQNTFTNEIQVTGVGESRRFSITRAGTWSATVTLQRSIGVTGLWEDVESYTTNDAITYADELDNQIVYYRIGVKTAAFTSGTAELALVYPLGSITGVARVTAYTSSAVVDAEVLSPLGGTDPTDIWAESLWSDYRGWPTAVSLYEGRLWWAGKNAIVASISDAFDAFDPDFEGDAGAINRTIGSGPVDDVSWILGGRRLLTGTEGSEMVVRASALDEPITPTNFNLKDISTQGSADVAASKMDTAVIFVQRAGRRIYELAYKAELSDYGLEDLTALVPEIGEPRIVALGIQRQPDTRIHCVRSDGTVALAVIDRNEKVLSWQEIETDGEVVDVCVLPDDEEDAVYYAVRRTIGATGLSSLAVTPGSGYTSVPTLTFSGGGGSNASATVTLKLVDVAVSAAGSGYAASDVITLVDGEFNTVATATVLTVDGAGSVLTIEVNSAGDYTEIPSNAVATTGGTGTGLTVTATWGLGVATIASPGGSYESAPTVTVNGDGTDGAVLAAISTPTLSAYYLEKLAKESECVGGTTNAQADSFVEFVGTPVAAVGGGYVSALSALSGAGYTAAPTLSFAGGGGTGAAATIGLKLVDVVVGAFGSGYSRGDVLTCAFGTFTRSARVQVLETFGPGWILTVQIVDSGNYSVIPAYYPTGVVTVTGGTGVGAAIFAVWGLDDPVLTSPGSGYTSNPVVTVSSVPLGPGSAGSTFALGLAGTVNASITVLTTSALIESQSISGLNHLEGKQVVVWGDSQDLSPDDENGIQRTYTVSGGEITLDDPVSAAVVGLPYEGRWKSSKLAYVVDDGEQTSLCQRKKIDQIGLVMANVHAKGIRFGPNFDTMDSLPETENEASVGANEVWAHYDKEMITFPGEWDTDSRLCLLARAPRPCTVLAAVIAMESHGKP